MASNKLPGLINLSSCFFLDVFDVPNYQHVEVQSVWISIFSDHKFSNKTLIPAFYKRCGRISTRTSTSGHNIVQWTLGVVLPRQWRQHRSGARGEFVCFSLLLGLELPCFFLAINNRSLEHICKEDFWEMMDIYKWKCGRFFLFLVEDEVFPGCKKRLVVKVKLGADKNGAP